MKALVFRSNGYLFALQASSVGGVSQEQNLPGISFADYFYHTYEEESHHVILAEGYVLHVREIVGIQELSGKVSPVPGYIFASGGGWIRGLVWHDVEPVLVLNETYLSEDLAGYVPELST